MKTTEIAVVVEPLPPAERDELQERENKIREALTRAYYEVGTELMAIRDKKLYREAHPTFELYCQTVWHWRRRYVDRLIGSVAAVDIIKGVSPIGLIALPTSEAVARPLTEIVPEAVPQAWERAVQLSPTPTAKHVEQAIRDVEQITGKPINKAVIKKIEEKKIEDKKAEEKKKHAPKIVPTKKGQKKEKRIHHAKPTVIVPPPPKFDVIVWHATNTTEPSAFRSLINDAKIVVIFGTGADVYVAATNLQHWYFPKGDLGNWNDGFVLYACRANQNIIKGETLQDIIAAFDIECAKYPLRLLWNIPDEVDGWSHGSTKTGLIEKADPKPVTHVEVRGAWNGAR